MNLTFILCSSPSAIADPKPLSPPLTSALCNRCRQPPPSAHHSYHECRCPPDSRTIQFPIAFDVFGYEAVKLYKEHKKRMSTWNLENICEASIEWTALNHAFCALCGIFGGIVGGLLGSGGGFILGPLLLD